MDRVDAETVEPSTYDPESRSHDRRPLSEPLGTEHLAINRYVLAPGERFSGSLHGHGDQEEVFLVTAGEATFEVRAADDPADETTVTVGEGELVRFAPGEFQTGYNDGDEQVVAFALGAPKDSQDVRIARIPGIGDVSCPDCGHDHMRVSPTDDEELVCPECGADWSPT